MSNTTNNSIYDPFKNEYFTTIVLAFLILYIVLVPNFPSQSFDILDNPLILFALLLFIVYVSNQNVTIALIASMAVLITIIIAKHQKKIMQNPSNNHNDNSYDEQDEQPTLYKTSHCNGKHYNGKTNIQMYDTNDVVVEETAKMGTNQEPEYPNYKIYGNNDEEITGVCLQNDDNYASADNVDSINKIIHTKSDRKSLLAPHNDR